MHLVLLVPVGIILLQSGCHETASASGANGSFGASGTLGATSPTGALLVLWCQWDHWC